MNQNLNLANNKIKYKTIINYNPIGRKLNGDATDFPPIA